VGGIETVRTGDIGKGFLAGLGAYGGANLAGSLAQTGAATAANAAPGVTEAVASGSLPQAAASVAPSAAPTVGQTALQASFAPAGTSAGGSLLAANPVTAATTMGATLPTGYAAAGEGIRALGTEAGRDAFLTASGGYSGLAADVGMAAAPSLLAQPEYKPPSRTEEESNYEGPYTPSERRVSYPGLDERRRTSEFMYFNPSNPVPFQKGGVPMLEDGGFVLTKKAVDGLGRGNNKKGQRVASAGLGAIPIRGKGTGTSDSIKTSIEGKRPALVSNGEAYVPKKQVAKKGGAKAFYALMDKAEKQAKKAKRA
jgi:hypothetical protein